MIQGPSSGSSQEAESRQIPFHSGIKVVMKGYCIGRIVDLRCVDSYEDLLMKLEDMFDIEGQLCGPTKKWTVAYMDDENDLMMLGDLPWHEFCGVARKMIIYPTNKAKKEVNTTLSLKIC